MSFKDSPEEVELQKRLELFQVFSRLYDQHREVLKEILALDPYGEGESNAAGLYNYIQGMVFEDEALLVTNLIKGQSQIIRQAQPIWRIGRDSSQVVVPIRDKRMSRRHAAIEYQPTTGFNIVDLGSSNGTFVNGDRIHEPFPLKDGDRIRLGSLTCSFFLCSDGQKLSASDSRTNVSGAGSVLPIQTNAKDVKVSHISEVEEDLSPSGFDATLHSLE